jgi:tetratricopeptide (TPR) repeat protein
MRKPILTLKMHHWLILILFSICLISCKDNESSDNDLLSEPPYTQLTDSIRRFPAQSDLYYRRGALLYSNNNMKEAESDLRKAWTLEPDEEHALSLTTILRQRNTDSALQFLKEASAKLPSSIAIRIGMARAYQQKNQPDSALVLCDEVIAHYPGELDALLLKADILQQTKHEAESLATLEKAYTYSPGDPELVHTLAFRYAESKNPKTLALSDSLIHADLENRHAEPYYFKGVYYANLGKYKEAINQFDEAIRHDFNFLEAYLNKGIAYYDQKKYKDAITTFQLAIRVDPSFADAFYWLGKTQEAMGDKEEAKTNYLKAFGLDKSMTEAKEASDRL